MLDLSGKVGIIIPCFNHGSGLSEIIGRIRTSIERPQIIVVDDGSLVPLSVPFGDVLLLRHSLNQGKSEAVRTGLSRLETSVQIVVFMDADGQHNPDDILRLLDPVLKGDADMSIGSRFAQAHDGIPLRHLLANRIVSRLFSIVFRRRVCDVLSGFRVVRRSLVEALPICGHGYTIECEMLILALRKRARIAEVPIFVDYDEKSSVSRGARLTFGLIFYILRTAVRRPKRTS